MKTLSLQHSLFSSPQHAKLSNSSTPTALLRFPSSLSPKAEAFPRTALSSGAGTAQPVKNSRPEEEEEADEENVHRDGCTRAVILGAVTVGVAAFLLGADDGHHSRALALGPEGPLVEEFWDNVRRYALYALTVSTGAIYTILQPIVELLKNPISAILILLILGGSFYIISQVLSAMIGITEFSYDYGY